MKSIIFVFAFIVITNLSAQQTVNPYFAIQNIDTLGNITQVKPLLSKKVNHDSPYQDLYTYDFDKNGKPEKIFYKLGTQSFAEFFIQINGSIELTFLYNEPFDIPETNEGFWFYIDDIFGDATPEILIFSKIGENCFLKIINYSAVKKKFVEHQYELNAQALSKQILIKNQRKIFMPYGSQGLFEEVDLIIE
jgi:hypothetical protein